ALIGTVIGMIAGRQSLTTVPIITSRNSVASLEVEKVNDASQEESRPILRLPGVAVVDVARVLAAHPMMDWQYEQLQSKLADISPTADKETRHRQEFVATFQWTEAQKLAQRDIQQIIAAYAASHHLSMVLDRSVRFREPCLMLYGENDANFHDIITAPGVKDITDDILKELPTRRPDASKTFRLPSVLLPGS